MYQRPLPTPPPAPVTFRQTPLRVARSTHPVKFQDGKVAENCGGLHA